MNPNSFRLGNPPTLHPITMENGEVAVLGKVNNAIVSYQTGVLQRNLQESLANVSFDSGFGQFLEKLAVESNTASVLLAKDRENGQGTYTELLRSCYKDLLVDSHIEPLIKGSFFPHTLSERKLERKLEQNTHVVATLAPTILSLANTAHMYELAAAGHKPTHDQALLTAVFNRACGFQSHMLAATGLEFSQRYQNLLKEELLLAHRNKNGYKPNGL